MSSTDCQKQNHDSESSIFDQRKSEMIHPDSKDLIEKVMINIALLSLMMGDTMVYFNAFKFDDLVGIFELSF
jgi:hypothetical protein